MGVPSGSEVAGSSPAVRLGRSSAGRAPERPPPLWFPGRSDRPVSCDGRAYFFWRRAVRACRSTRHRSSTRFPDRPFPTTPTHDTTRFTDMGKFSGTKRRPLPHQPHGADPHAVAARLHARGRRGVRARSRVGAVPPRRDEHGRRGHVLRARRRARRAVRRARPRGDDDEPGVPRGRRRRRRQGRSRAVPASRRC